MSPDNIVAIIMLKAGALSLFAKGAVDLLRKSPLPSPGWTLPLAAIIAASILAMGLSILMDNPLTLKEVVMNLFVGGVAGLGAVVATELQRSADKTVSSEDKKDDK